jgi:hypothetical protein
VDGAVGSLVQGPDAFVDRVPLDFALSAVDTVGHPEPVDLDVQALDRPDVPGTVGLDVPALDGPDVPGTVGLDVPALDGPDVPGAVVLDVPALDRADVPGADDLDVFAAPIADDGNAVLADPAVVERPCATADDDVGSASRHADVQVADDAVLPADDAPGVSFARGVGVRSADDFEDRTFVALDIPPLDRVRGQVCGGVAFRSRSLAGRFFQRVAEPSAQRAWQRPSRPAAPVARTLRPLTRPQEEFGQSRRRSAAARRGARLRAPPRSNALPSGSRLERGEPYDAALAVRDWARGGAFPGGPSALHGGRCEVAVGRRFGDNARDQHEGQESHRWQRN